MQATFIRSLNSLTSNLGKKPHHEDHPIERSDSDDGVKITQVQDDPNRIEQEEGGQRSEEGIPLSQKLQSLAGAERRSEVCHDADGPSNTASQG